jgi:hypothetical protein
MFKKLNQNFLKNDFKDWELLQGQELISRYESFGTVLEYFKISNVELLKNIHTRKFFSISPDRVSIAKITGSGFLYPHIDHGVTTVLNYYISADKDSTIFYNPKSNSTPTEYPGKLSKNVYHLHDLNEIGRFSAESGDVYMLDVSQIHSVNKRSPSTRIFLNYSWFSASFRDVLMDIETINNGHI